eukprot:2336996-Amphidinium_carterae.1
MTKKTGDFELQISKLSLRISGIFNTLEGSENLCKTQDISEYIQNTAWENLWVSQKYSTKLRPCVAEKGKQ